MKDLVDATLGLGSGADTWILDKLDHSDWEYIEKWDKRFLELAKQVSTWSKDPSTKVGAVIVRPDNSVCSVGYNGFAKGIVDSPERYADRDLKYELIVHAEMNAKEFAREPVHGYTLYSHPFMPCTRCTGPLINAGIKRIVSYKCEHERWDFTDSKLQCCEARINVTLYDFGV